MVFERDQQKEYRLVSISPIHDRKGTFIGRLIILRDINEQKQAQLELEQYTEEVKLLSTEYQSFAYSVSHDLQAPVRAVAGFSGLLIDNLEGQLDKENLDLLLRIRAASRRMENMISALLTLSRVSRNPLRLEEVNIKNLAEDVLEELEKTQPEHRVQTSIQADFSIRADPDLIRLLIQNLLSNAWKYTTLVPDPHIRLTASRQEGENMICIEDNGIGFPMDRADKLFEPFQRLVDEESYPGLGIGLATARKIVQRHGGKIWAESEPGKGARFYFTLPEDP
jgi:signal transduction histidine kinase